VLEIKSSGKHSKSRLENCHTDIEKGRRPERNYKSREKNETMETTQYSITEKIALRGNC
jgi:hypothetical protein